VSTQGGGWFDALAASRGQIGVGDARQTTCGLVLTDRSLGVTEPVLPCHAKIEIRFGNQTFLTEVIDNRLTAGGRQFEMTDALAQRMGLDGVQRIEWRFAAPR
jgi:hypothetical protein